MVLLAKCWPSIHDCSCVENASDLNDCSQWNKTSLAAWSNMTCWSWPFLHHVRWYNYVFLRRALKYFIFHSPNLPPCKNGLFAPDMEFICGSNTVWDKCLSELSSSSPVSVNNIMGFKYDQIVKQTISELRGNKTTLTKKKKKKQKEVFV